MEIIFELIVNLIFFQVGRILILIATFGRINPSLDDKPFNSMLVALLGFFATAFIIFVTLIA